MTGRIVFRIFLGLIVIALLAGAGARLYQIGVARGLALAPQLADRLPPGALLMPYAPYGPWGYRPFGWGFGFGFFFPVLFFFGIWFLISRFFFWCRWGGRANWDERRQMLDEWHRRAHGWGPSEGPQQQSPSPQG
jgi:hypothetical protein